MDFKYLFTSFEGRIGRKDFWLGLLVIIIASFVLIGVLGILTWVLPVSFVSLVGSLIMLYPALALSLKRLHDRNKAAKPWAYIMFGPGILTNIMQAMGVGFTTTEIQGELVTYPSNGLATALSVITAIVGLWVLVELGFLKGTTGDNQFGSDPVSE